MSTDIYDQLRQKYNLRCKNEEIILQLAFYNYYDEISTLIDSDIFDLGYHDSFDRTLLNLLLIFSNKHNSNAINVILKLIETGKSSPEIIDWEGNSVLIYAYNLVSNFINGMIDKKEFENIFNCLDNDDIKNDINKILNIPLVYAKESII